MSDANYGLPDTTRFKEHPYHASFHPDYIADPSVGYSPNYGKVAGGAAFVFSDLLDGLIARAKGTSSKWGAFLDSSSDRVADSAIFGSIAIWYAGDGKSLQLAAAAIYALAAGGIISYVKARAESLGFQARGGLMERAERLVLIGVGLAFDILVPVLWIMLVLTAITALQRFVKVWRQATPQRPRRTRHHRGSGTEEPRAGSLAQWWAAHRPQTERSSGSRSASRRR